MTLEGIPIQYSGIDYPRLKVKKYRIQTLNFKLKRTIFLQLRCKFHPRSFNGFYHLLNSMEAIPEI